LIASGDIWLEVSKMKYAIVSMTKITTKVIATTIGAFDTIQYFSSAIA
jgi:hypothetical protein